MTQAASGSNVCGHPAPSRRIATPAHPKVARVLFDEAHSEAWTIRPEVPRRVQPAHPGDSSYAVAASALAEREFEVTVNAEEKLTPELLADVDVLVIAHPSDLDARY